MAEHDDSIVAYSTACACACAWEVGMGFVGFESTVERTAVLELPTYSIYYLLFFLIIMCIERFDMELQRS